MKRLIIGDLHLGVNENDSNYLDYQLKSLQWIIGLLIEHKAPYDLLGDLFHNRKGISHNALNLYNYIIANTKEQGVFIVGNHDAPYKNTNELNSISLLNDKTVVSNEVYTRNNTCYCPWINKENVENIINQLQDSKCKYCLGHFEIGGFLLQKGILSQESTITKSMLRKFDLVISGHYHIHSKQDNIIYLGSPYEMNFSDVGVDKYVMLFDDETGEYELIKNPYTYFVEVEIDSEDSLIEVESLFKKKVKLIINCERTIKIENWIIELTNNNDNVKIQDNYVIDSYNLDTKVVIKNTNLYDMWFEYIETIQDIPNKDVVNSIFEDVYKLTGEN